MLVDICTQHLGGYGKIFTFHVNLVYRVKFQANVGYIVRPYLIKPRGEMELKAKMIVFI